MQMKEERKRDHGGIIIGRKSIVSKQNCFYIYTMQAKPNKIIRAIDAACRNIMATNTNSNFIDCNR